jgi:hypothetical protein
MALPAPLTESIPGIADVDSQSELRAELARLRVQLAQFQREQTVIGQLFRNDKTTPIERVVYLALQREIEYQQSAGAADPAGFVHVRRGSVAAISGMSTRRVGPYLTRFKEYGLLEKKTVQTTSQELNKETGELEMKTRGEIWIRQAGGFVERIRAFAHFDPKLPDHKRWGGPRVQCPRCGSERLRVFTYQCEECGEKFEAGVGEGQVVPCHPGDADPEYHLVPVKDVDTGEVIDDRLF